MHSTMVPFTASVTGARASAAWRSQFRRSYYFPLGVSKPWLPILSSSPYYHYASCLEYLDKLKPILLLDIHLHDHVEILYTKIRHKAIIQYTHPFISVDLNTMAGAFKTSVAGLEKELAALITENQIQARIDSHNKILYARHADQRNATFQRTLHTGVEFARDIRAILLRANLMKYENNLKASRKL